MDGKNNRYPTETKITGKTPLDDIAETRLSDPTTMTRQLVDFYLGEGCEDEKSQERLQRHLAKRPLSQLIGSELGESRGVPLELIGAEIHELYPEVVLALDPVPLKAATMLAHTLLERNDAMIERRKQTARRWSMIQ